jgi:uncharacterized protein
MTTRRQFLGAAFAAPAGAGLYTWRMEPVWLEVVSRELPIRGLPAALVGRTLIQLSDLHVGPVVDDRYLAQVFQRVTALAPDIVALTGDFITYKGLRGFSQLRRVLETVPHGRLATVAVLGNHDYGRRWAEREVSASVVEALHQAGVTVLRNESVDVLGLTVVGLDDLWAQRLAMAPIRAIDPLRPALVLLHNPDAVDLDGWTEYRGWILAGHTHGGQCKPPFLPPPLLPVTNRRYVAGEIELAGGRRLYVNRGVGHTLRVRFNCRPEVTVFRLVALP